MIRNMENSAALPPSRAVTLLESRKAVLEQMIRESFRVARENGTAAIRSFARSRPADTLAPWTWRHQASYWEDSRLDSIRSTRPGSAQGAP